MHIRIADTFTASLARLTGDEQKVVKTTAFDLQLNPANPGVSFPGMSFHNLDKACYWTERLRLETRCSPALARPPCSQWRATGVAGATHLTPRSSAD